MNELLISVLLATMAVLAIGAVLLLGLIALAGIERPRDMGLTQRLLCRLSFDRLGCCDVAGRAG